MPKLASAEVSSSATPAPHQHATPLSATMVNDLPAMTQFASQVGDAFADSIVAMAPLAAAPHLGNGPTNTPNLFSTPANSATPAAQSQIDTPSNGGFVTELGPGLRLLDRYEIQRKIGQGGMSTVYEAFDSVRGEKVALKVLLPKLAAQPVLQERFLQEGRLSSNFSHPNIARVYDLHQTESLIFLSMELLHGTTLRHDMNRRKDQRQIYRPTEVLTMLDDICDALEVVHAEGVVHRDLKPENLWLGLDGSVKVMDFGIAREASGTSYTSSGRGSGTPYYIAPEQLAASPTMDDRADQYSVAIIMYELLTGELPQGAIVPPHERNADIPRKMSEAIFRALDSEPTNRFDKISELREASKFRVEQTLLAKIAKPVISIALIAFAGFAFVRWGAPLFEKSESPIWEEMGTQRVVEGQEIKFTTRSALCTIDGGALKFKLLADAPIGAKLDSQTGEFAWTPTEAQGPQDYTFTVMAIAKEEGRAPVVHERSFSVDVTEQIDSPIFSMPEPATGKEHEELRLEIAATDPNLPTIGLRYELPKSLPGMTIDRSSGVIQWIPNEQQGGKNYQIPIRVYLEGDAQVEHYTQRILNLQVVESIDAPVIYAQQQWKGAVGVESNLRVTVRDPNTPPIDDYFALKNADRIGMTIDPQTGVVYWTPTEDQLDAEQEVTVQVLWDNAGKTSVLSEKVVQVTVVDDPEEVADQQQAEIDTENIDTPVGGSPGGFGGGYSGGGLSGGGAGGANCADGKCKSPNTSLPGTGQNGAAVFGSPFPSSVGSNRPSGGGGQRPSGGGNTGGGGNNLGQVIGLIQQIKQHKQKQPQPKPSNKLPPGWQNKPPNQGIRWQDLQKKGQNSGPASKKPSFPAKYTKDLPIRKEGKSNSSKLPLQPAPQRSKSVQSWQNKLRNTQRTTSKLPSSGLNNWQQQLRSRQSQSFNRQRATSPQQSKARSSQNQGNKQSKTSSQWNNLKKASSYWKKR